MGHPKRSPLSVITSVINGDLEVSTLERRLLGTRVASVDRLPAQRPKEPGVWPPSFIWTPPREEGRHRPGAAAPGAVFGRSAGAPDCPCLFIACAAGCSISAGCGDDLANMSPSWERTGEKGPWSSHNTFTPTFHLPLAGLNLLGIYIYVFRILSFVPEIEVLEVPVIETG